MVSGSGGSVFATTLYNSWLSLVERKNLTFGAVSDVEWKWEETIYGLVVGAPAPAAAHVG